LIDTGELEGEKKFDASFEIVFDKGQPLEGQSIVPTLSNLADVVEGFIEVCETTFVR
jgi:hypothetical protein